MSLSMPPSLQPYHALHQTAKKRSYKDEFDRFNILISMSFHSTDDRASVMASLQSDQITIRRFKSPLLVDDVQPSRLSLAMDVFAQN